MNNRGCVIAISVICCCLYAGACQNPQSGQITILTGGIQHESNTFIPVLTTEDNFKVAAGREALENQEWAKVLSEAGVNIIPTLHASAEPFGVVERSTFDRFKDKILAGARNAGKLDGVYLDMHGAMHVEGYPDGQASFIRQLRDIVGPNVLICGSFDLHGNMSGEFVSHLDILTAYRTAPHVDGAQTRVRAVKLLLDAIRRKERPVIAHINIPILIPGEKGVTSVEPLRSFYERLSNIASMKGLLDASIFVGMPWTDVRRAGMSVQVVAQNSSYFQEAQQQAKSLAQEIWNRRSELNFDVPVDNIDGAIEQARKVKETVFITDSGDNTTAGAPGDSTNVLERLLHHRVEDAVFAGIVDPDAVAACESAGVGATVNLVTGGKIDNVFSKPYPIQGRVIYVSPDHDRSSYKRAAVVQVGGVQLVLLGVRRSFTSPRDFEDVGIRPLDHKIVVVKLGYLFQELRDIAPHTIMALTPGFCYQLMEGLEYKNVRRPVYPLDKEMTWTVGEW